MSTLILLFAVLTAAPAENPPNFVFILVDDLGWTDGGYLGSGFYETPNIDKLAGQGMVFANAYANGPNCAPTRACLMTGQYTPRHGIYTVKSSARGASRLRKLIPVENTTILEDEAVTLAEALKPAGYVSACIGKWHLGDDPEHGPVSQGFDVNIGGGIFGHPPAGYFAPHKLPGLEEAPKKEYLTDRLTDEALKFMEKNKEKPFFLYLSHYAVHTPIEAKQELVRKYKKKDTEDAHWVAEYAAMIEHLDEGVGKVMNKIEALELAERTVVVFFSDNGGALGITFNDPLRGGKGMLYEGGIRVPMIVCWPGKIEAGTRSAVPVMGADFYPTFLELAGAARPENHEIDGESLVPILTKEGELEREAVYWHFPAYLQGGKAVKDPWRTTPASVVRKGDWKLLEFFEDGKLELYNLADDVWEHKDLAVEKPEKVEELHQLLKEWRKSVNAPVPTEPNPGFDPTAAPFTKPRKKINK